MKPVGTAQGTPPSSTRTRGENVQQTEERRQAVRQAAEGYYRLRIWHQRRRGLPHDLAMEVVAEGTAR